MLKTSSYLFLILILLSCKRDTQEHQLHEALKSYYSHDQIDELLLVKSHFENYVVQGLNLKSSKKENIYKAYNNHLSKYEYEGDLKVPFEQSIKFQVSDMISPELASDIWVNPENFKESFTNANYNLDGKYWKMLGDYRNTNDMIDKYLLIYQQTGDLSPSHVAGFIKESQAQDFKQALFQLFVAMHYVSLNKF